MDRRDFIRFSTNCAVTTVAVFGLSSAFVERPSDSIPNYEPNILRPPGALKEKDFLSACIRCNLCQDACPDNVIRLATSIDPVQKDTPFILPTSKGCRLCLDCTKVCPTGALRPVETMDLVKMGVAVVDKRTCVSHNGTGVCGACHTACPLKNKAIVQGLRNAPEVIDDACVGCGLCEEACIIKGTKAIRVFSERGV